MSTWKFSDQSDTLNLLHNRGNKEYTVRNNSKSHIKITEIKFITGVAVGENVTTNVLSGEL